jgi:hypothetical protein
MDAAKAIRFSYVGGVKNGEVIEAPITTEYRHALFQVIDLLAKIDLIYAAGVEAAPLYKKIVEQYYSFNGVPSDSEKRMLYVNIIEITRIKFATIPEQASCDQRIASLKDSLVCAYGCLINLPQILQ